MKKLFALLIMALLLAISAPVAKADMIDQWSYRLDGVFTYWENNRGDSWHYGQGFNNTRITPRDPATLRYDYKEGVYGTGSQSGARTIRWGSNPYSSISLSPTAGTVDTNGPAAAGLDLTHNNEEIAAAAPELSYGQALLTLALSPGSPLINPIIYSTLFDFYFIETPNGNANTEQDVFIVENPLLSATESFIIDGITYTFSFAASFTELTGYYANLVRETFGWDADKAVYGWTTREDRSTTFPTSFIITASSVPAPEPATMLLLSFGLTGLGMMARKRRQR